MPEQLAEWEVEELVAQIHETQRALLANSHEREQDAELQRLTHARVLAEHQLKQAQQEFDAAASKYADRARLLIEREDELRARIESGWPLHAGKTIGYATLATRRGVELATTPVDAFRTLDRVLGATGALPKLVTGLKIDAKAALPLIESMPALSTALRVTSTQILTIRKPATSDGGETQ